MNFIKTFLTQRRKDAKGAKISLMLTRYSHFSVTSHLLTKAINEFIALIRLSFAFFASSRLCVEGFFS